MQYISIILFFLSTTILAESNVGNPINKNDNQYVISGVITEAEDGGDIVLSIFDPISQTKTEIGSTTTNAEGRYSLEYTYKEPDLYRLDIYKKQSVMLVIGEGQHNIQLDADGISKGKVVIKGSLDSKLLQSYDNFRLESNARLVKPTYTAMREASKSEDHEAEIEAVESYAHASEAHRVELLDFTEQELRHSIALYGSMLRWTGDEEIERLDNLVKAFKAKHPDLKMTKVMEDKVDRFRSVALGAITPNITLPDSAGILTNLKDIKGEYTLIDFWASWCGPCLLQIPDLKDAYDEFGNLGFEILGVSIDNNESRWLKAIQKYDMQWPQLSDLKGWGSEAAADYNVTFIPFNVLIDNNGKIIAKNLHSKALNKKLHELLK